MNRSEIVITILVVLVIFLGCVSLEMRSDVSDLKRRNSALDFGIKSASSKYLTVLKDNEKLLEENKKLREENDKLKKEINSWRKIENVKLTAYCPCDECSGGWGKQTKLGTTAKEGRTIAVDPKLIPLGSEVLIEGKVYIAEDIGGAVKGKVIDIYFDEHKSNFRKYVDVLVRIQEVVE